MSETLSALRVQLQEVAAKLDERHGVFDEKIAEVNNGLEGAFSGSARSSRPTPEAGRSSASGSATPESPKPWKGRHSNPNSSGPS